jgi:hypothetical protein
MTSLLMSEVCSSVVHCAVVLILHTAPLQRVVTIAQGVVSQCTAKYTTESEGYPLCAEYQQILTRYC